MTDFGLHHLFEITDYMLNFTVTAHQAVPTAKGQALADEYGIKFFETVSFCLNRTFLVTVLVSQSIVFAECQDKP